MRDGPLPRWMQHAIPALAVAGIVLVVILLCSCVTVHECGVGFEQRKLQAGRTWDAR